MLQLNLFEEPKEIRGSPKKQDNAIIIDSYKDEFIKYCKKLKATGCNSIDKSWWRSRFYEFLKCDEDSKTDEIWREKTEKYNTWNMFWDKHRNEILDQRWHHLPFEEKENDL